MVAGRPQRAAEIRLGARGQGSVLIGFGNRPDQDRTQLNGGVILIDCMAEPNKQKLTDAHFDAAAGYWNSIYKSQDVDAAIYRNRQTAVLSLVRSLEMPKDRRVLEIGCGAGFTSVALAQAGYQVQATDSVNAMIKLAQQHAHEAGAGDRVTTSLQDVHALAFPDNSFPLVLMVGVAPWLHSLDKAFAEVSRVLQPGGYLIATADNYWRLNYWLDPRYLPPFGPIRKGIRSALESVSLRKPSGLGARLYSIEQFDANLAAAGLEKIKGRTVGFGPITFLGQQLLPDSTGVKFHNWLQGLADRKAPLIRSAGTHYIVLARKGATP